MEATVQFLQVGPDICRIEPDGTIYVNPDSTVEQLTHALQSLLGFYVKRTTALEKLCNYTGHLAGCGHPCNCGLSKLRWDAGIR